MIEPGFIIAFFGAVGLFLISLAVARVRRRPLAAIRSGIGGLVCLGVAALLVSVAFNLYSYHRLTREQQVATLGFEQLGEQRFRARIEAPGQAPRVYDLSGDQWQLEARVLKWQGPAILAGFDARYRLERLTGRYASAHQETSRLRTAHDLAASRGLDLWQVAQRYPGWLPMVDAAYGSATYLPMRDGARYQVSLTQSGLIARPDNDSARHATEEW